MFTAAGIFGAVWNALAPTTQAAAFPNSRAGLDSTALVYLLFGTLIVVVVLAVAFVLWRIWEDGPR